MARHAPRQQCPAGWLVKVTNEVIQGLEHVAANLDDAIGFDSDPVVHVKAIRALFKRLRKKTLKCSLSKDRLGATDADFLSHPSCPAGMRPNAEKVSALTEMSIPRDIKQVRALVGGIGHNRNIGHVVLKRTRPITTFLHKGANLFFTPPEVIVPEMLTELAALLLLVFPEWEAVADGSRPCHVYCNACINGVGAALEQ